jgi:hypothetical protein
VRFCADVPWEIVGRVVEAMGRGDSNSFLCAIPSVVSGARAAPCQ